MGKIPEAKGKRADEGYKAGMSIKVFWLDNCFGLFGGKLGSGCLGFETREPPLCHTKLGGPNGGRRGKPWGRKPP